MWYYFADGTRLRLRIYFDCKNGLIIDSYILHQKAYQKGAILKVSYFCNIIFYS